MDQALKAHQSVNVAFMSSLFQSFCTKIRILYKVNQCTPTVSRRGAISAQAANIQTVQNF